MTDLPASPHARRRPQQPRGQETFTAILDAAGELFAERGYEATTTHRVASAAGISVGALYRYFADKQSICKELYQREVSGLRKRLLEQVDITDLMGTNVREIIRRTLELAFRIYSEKPALRRVLAEQSRKIPELVELRRTQEAEVHDAVRRILSSVSSVQVPDAEAGAFLITLFIESLVDEWILHGSRPGELDQPRIVEAATDFIYRYALGRVS
jgi:AcrR family transcriptional regulator